MERFFVGVVLAAFFCGGALGQSAPKAPVFEAADVMPQVKFSRRRIAGEDAGLGGRHRPGVYAAPGRRTRVPVRIAQRHSRGHCW